MTRVVGPDGRRYLRRAPRRDAPDRHLVARWFDDERRVLRAVAPLVPAAPRLGPAVAGPGFLLRPIDGDALQDRFPAPSPVPEAIVSATIDLLTGLSALPLRKLPGLPYGRGMLPTPQFLGEHLNRLAARYRLGEFGPLLDWLGIPPVPVPRALLRPRLTARPRSLVHGDAHRGNLIVDGGGALPPPPGRPAPLGPLRLVGLVDWELAQVGDPLYEAASHVWLMRYPADRAADVLGRWRAALPPAHARGWEEDLPVYLALEDIRSALVDTVRQGDGLRRRNVSSVRRDDPAVVILEEALNRAARHFGERPHRLDVQVALEKWLDAVGGGGGRARPVPS